ncbi:4'-phosphopantetheinyl transferase superfamily protein [Pseudophaeobacter sp. EL27]|uniref:4'-phosphopantetheinyl transferase family protein n=1 Tax=Pseudophaeobacter sp. EL27 TaxID=2107580 RepID=UPI000EFD9944|nr:hypothetical protein [Pseudophaeobacter sp. EL27]
MMRQNVSLFLCPVVDLDEGLLAALLAELTLQERQRARRFSCNQAHHLFVVAHAALHWALRDAGVHRYDLCCNPQGKPYLKDHPDLHFNLSHTEGLIAVALCSGRPMGVDVERLADLQTYQELAARVMTPAECSYMAAQSTPQDRFRGYGKGLHQLQIAAASTGQTAGSDFLMQAALQAAASDAVKFR